MDNLIMWITSSLAYGTVIMYGALGETFTQRTGNLNLGTPGIMAIGAGAAFVGAFAYESATDSPSKILCFLIPLVCAFAASMLAGLLYTFLTVTLRANQNVTGLALTIFGVGLAKFLGKLSSGNKTSIKAVVTNQIYSANIQTATGQRMGAFGRIFFSYGFMLYLAIILVVLASFLLFHSRIGLNLRAVGENPAAADAVGVNVTKYKYLTIVLASAVSGLGGAYYVLDFGNGIWSTAVANDIEAIGWLAVALVIFASWKPLNLIWGSYIFGLCYWAYNYVPQLIHLPINTDIAQMLPYIVTIVVLVITSIRKKRENQPPASLGLSYFREER